MQRFVGRQFAKAVNECKSQAINARRLVESIEKTKGWSRRKVFRKGKWFLVKGNAKLDDEEDAASWGSDFDSDYTDEDPEEPGRDSDTGSNLCESPKSSHEQTVSKCSLVHGPMATSEGSSYWKSPSTSSVGESSENSSPGYESLLDIASASSRPPVNGRLTGESPVGCDERLADNVLPTAPLQESKSPKPSPRVFPRPPTKPIIPPKPLLSKSNTTTTNNNNNLTEIVEMRPKMKRKKITRPPSEPPPPPLPKSPPPTGLGNKPTNEVPELTLDELNQVLAEQDDDYEPPICVPNEPRPASSSSSSNHSHTVKSSDSESGSGSVSFQISPLPPPPAAFDDTYEAMHSSMFSGYSTPNLSITDQNYSVVEEEEEKGGPLHHHQHPSHHHHHHHHHQPTLNGGFGSHNWRVSAAHKCGLETEPDRPKLPLPRAKLDSHSSTTLKLRIPEKLKSLPERLMSSRSERCLNTIDNWNGTFGNTSYNPAHRPLPPVPLHGPKAKRGAVNNNRQEYLNQLLHNYEWFHDVEREEAANMLKSRQEEGGYLVRCSRRAGKSNPFTLTIYHNEKIFHLNIRKRPDDIFALGKEKEREKTFSTVQELIEYHQNEPILLTTKGQPAGMTKLLTTPSH